MASSSILKSAPLPSHPFDPFDVDGETSRLIAQLTLDDIAEVANSRKGKGRADAPLSDEEVAFRAHCEYWENIVRFLDDRRIAESFNQATTVDQSYLRAIAIVEQAAEDDHQAALALAEERDLPQPSQAQRLLEDPLLYVPLENAQSPVTSDDDVSTNQSLEPPVEKLTTSKVIPAATQGPTSSSSEQHIVSQRTRAQCVSCGDLIRDNRHLQGPCGHDYCGHCLLDLVDACTRDDTLYPPRCCGQPFPYEAMVQFLTPKVRSTFDTKRIELEVPATNRIFCPNQTCSSFIGSSENAAQNLLCSECGTFVCSLCRQTSHPGDNCSENAALMEVIALAQKEHWQTCPGCKAIIELSQGCYHITCRCHAEFCYLCAAPWKGCACPHWDEDRLLDTAQLRVQQGAAVGTQVSQPVLQGRIQRMADVLRENHNCATHQWRRQNSSAMCEECLFTLPNFILVCRNCHLRACNRCARNRL